MSLLDSINIPVPVSADPVKNSAIVNCLSIRDLMLNQNVYDLTSEQIGGLEPDSIKSILSLGGTHARHVLGHVVDQTGPVKLFFTTWAFSLRSVKTILDLHDNGHIELMGCILSDRVETECPQAFQLLKANTDKYWLKKNHAKGFIAWNDKWKISVRMTANFTENNRCETFDIFSSESCWRHHKSWIETIINENIN